MRVGYVIGDPERGTALLQNITPGKSFRHIAYNTIAPLPLRINLLLFHGNNEL